MRCVTHVARARRRPRPSSSRRRSPRTAGARRSSTASRRYLGFCRPTAQSCAKDTCRLRADPRRRSRAQQARAWRARAARRDRPLPALGRQSRAQQRPIRRRARHAAARPAVRQRHAGRVHRGRSGDHLRTRRADQRHDDRRMGGSTLRSIRRWPGGRCATRRRSLPSPPTPHSSRPSGSLRATPTRRSSRSRRWPTCGSTRA